MKLKTTYSESSKSQGKRKSKYIFRLSVLFLSFLNLFIVLSGCDESFQTLKDNNEAPFSMFGFIDASADTQWVRIIPLREQVETFPVKPEMDVTIEDLQTGEIFEMSDSLFTLRQEFKVLNSWAAVDVQPGQSYLLKAILPNGLASTAFLTTPKDFPDPDTSDFRGGCSGNLRLNGIENLADVKSVWHIRFYFSGREDERIIAVPYRSRVDDFNDGKYSVYIDTIGELNFIDDQSPFTADSMDVLRREIFVASAGPEWDNNITSLDEMEYSLPIMNSNVENGVGYMIGIVSKKVSLDHCF